jgi:PAS domain S-box-containing protein
LRVPRDKLLSGIVKAVDVREYDQADGLQSTEGVKRSRSVVSDSAGRIWFSLNSGLSVVNPSQINDNSFPALPHIEAITADDNPVNLAASIRIPPSPRRITFAYTGLSLAVPGRIRFRYFLENFDNNWSQPVAAREAVYTNLGPGSYRFRLVASNSEGLWNGPETVIALNVALAYYQTYWFRLSCIAVFIALLSALYRWRVHRLKSQEKRLRDVVETIPAMTFTALSNGFCIFVNKRWTEYTGLSVEQTSGAGWQRAVHPEDLVRHSEKWRTSVATGRLFEDETRFRRAADGEYRWFLVRSVPLRDQHGKIIRWYGTLTDIEDRKRAEEKLRRSEAYLSEAQKLSHMGSFGWDVSSGEIHWSLETFRIFEYDPTTKVTIDLVLQRIHPEDRPTVEQLIERVSREGTEFDFEHRLLMLDGSLKYLRVVGDPLKDHPGSLQFVGAITDITERKQAEEALRRSEDCLHESEQSLRLIVDGIAGLVAIMTAEGEVQFVNNQTLEYFGKTLEELKGWSTGDAVHPDDLPQAGAAWMHSVNTGDAYDVDHRLRRADGAYRWFHSRGLSFRDAEGRIARWYVLLTDIDDRKRAEEALQRSQFYLSEGQRLAHTGSCAFNALGFFDYWSDESFQIYGLDPQKGPPTLEQYLDTVYPQDRDFVAETIKRMQAERCGCDMKKRIVRPDGELRYVRCVGIPIIEDETLKGFLGTSIDITEQELLTQELERRQAHLTQAQELTHTGSWAWGVEDRGLVHLSAQWYRIYGFDPAKGAPGWEERLERVHPEDRHKWKGTIERAIVEKADYDLEFRIVLPNGTVKWIHTVGHPVVSTAGDLKEVVGSSTDITERKSAEQESARVHQLEADLAHINRVSMLGEMAASLAHEIKQPLAATITSANSCMEWLAHDPPALDRARAAAARIDKYANRATEIIDRIRSLYKKSPPERELVDVNGIIDEMLTLLSGEATRYSVAVRTERGADLPGIMADRVQLQQVFMNLMLNAIEAMKDSGGGELTVKSQLQDGLLQFSISDTGVGLPTEGMNQMFSAFFTTKPKGSGMGLAISRSIVESHGGQLWATANEGRGATFHFTLPTHAMESSPLVAGGTNIARPSGYCKE